MEQIVLKFLKALHVSISEKYVERLISEHPDFPSLVSISDTLHRLGIDNVARRINVKDLNELPYPYLLPFGKGNGDILLIKNKRDLVKHKSALEKWSGIVLQAEPKAQLKDNLNNKMYSKEVLIKICGTGLKVALGILLFFPFINSFHLLPFTILFTAIAGALVGYFIVAKELGVSYAAVDAFCNAGKSTSCDRILDAKINLLGIKFSDAVVIYFLFQVVVIVVLKEHFSTAMQVLAWLSILTLPIIAFSLYYQYFIAKTWCRLCLLVAVILALQFIIFSIGYLRGGIQLLAYLPLTVASTLVLLFACIAFLVLLIKAREEKSSALEQMGKNANRVKHSPTVFMQILTQQKRIDTKPFDREMVLGSPVAPVNIIAVSGLYCSPCKIKHEVIDQLIRCYPEKVSVTLRFVPNGKDDRAVGYLLRYWDQCIYNKDNESENTIKLMRDWFDIWDLRKFMTEFPIHVGERSEEIEMQHYKWVDEVGIQATPTFFVNRYELPKEYVIDDLLALIPSLADYFNEVEKTEMTLQTTV